MSESSDKLHYKVSDLMQGTVMSTTRSQSVEHARKVMHEHHVNCLPVADSDNQPIGILTTSDLMDGKSDTRRVGDVMSSSVLTIPLYADASLAAKTMRKHHTHHLIVVDEKRIVGVLSSFDLLLVLEDKRATKKRDRKTVRPRRLSGGRRETEIHGHVEE